LQNLTLQGLPVPWPLPSGVRPEPNILNRGTLIMRNDTLTLVGDGTLIAPSAIENYGTLNTQGTRVAGFMGAYQSSAPIWNVGSATINDSTFLNNSHRPSVHRGVDDGGAIFNAGVLTVNDSTFADNGLIG